jgi:hypothetical protein
MNEMDDIYNETEPNQNLPFYKKPAIKYTFYFIIIAVPLFLLSWHCYVTATAPFREYITENKEDVFKKFISEKIPDDVVVLNGWVSEHFAGNSGVAIFTCSLETLKTLTNSLDMKDISQEFHGYPYNKEGRVINDWAKDKFPWWDLKYSQDLLVYEVEWPGGSKTFYYYNISRKCYFAYFAAY